MEKKKKGKKKEEAGNKKTVRVRESLDKFDIQINTFGQIKTNYDIDEINEFLNQNVEDKKLKNLKGKEENADDN